MKINGVCFDISIDIIKYLDITDIAKFFRLSKEFYQLYLDNNDYFNKILINRILGYFYFERKLNFYDNGQNESQRVSQHDIQNILKILLKTHRHFRYHRCSHKVDFLSYMIENDLDSDRLFEYYANFCNFEYKYNIDNLTRIITADTDEKKNTDELSHVSLLDMKYILTYSNNNQLKIMLRIFTIPVSILTYIIDELVLVDGNDQKINLLIDYMFYKFCFGFFDAISKSYIHKMISNLIKNKKTKILQHFFINKRKYFKGNSTLDYQELVNEIISLRDKTHLKMLLNELKIDNDRFVTDGINPMFVIINTHLIIKICKDAEFLYLKNIVDDILGECINYDLYVQSICEGLQYINLNEIEKIQCLSKNFTEKTKHIINNCLKVLYENKNIKKHFYIK